ncbi:hypothetical protein BGZ68_006991 [Mortierella alpina]|nr:hypothetical protein BGZ68_006991 [Mortierella alpina]
MPPTAVLTTVPAALSDPKVLLNVFSLLLRKDLQHGASFVCREWYIVARPLLYPAGLYWLGKVPLTRQYILEDLHGIQTLPAIGSTSAHFYIRPICSRDESTVRAGHWSHLQTQIRKLLVKDPESQFQKLLVSGSLDLSMEALEPVYVNNVTTLKLTCSCDGLAPLALHEYLCDSPQLRNLAINNILYPAEYMDMEPVALNKAGYYSPRGAFGLAEGWRPFKSKWTALLGTPEQPGTRVSCLLTCLWFVRTCESSGSPETR